MPDYDFRFKFIQAPLWQRIVRIDEVKGQWQATVGLSPQILRRLKQSVLVTSSGASTRIDGARLSDDEVERLMRGLSSQALADRDAQEVRGYFETLQLVFDSGPDMPLTESTIKHLHAQLLRYTTKDQRHRGQYKTLDNSVHATDAGGQVVSVLFATTPAYLTPKQMAELVTWTTDALDSGRHHPLLVIASFLVEFLKIHPFLDGNGRPSRLLTNLLMLQAGYRYMPYASHEHLIELTKADYYIALRRSQTSFGTSRETIEPWLEYFLDVCLRQAEQATSLLSVEAVEQQLSERQLSVWRYLNTVAVAAPGEIARATGVPQPTVAQALSKLVKLDVVERQGQARATRYRRRTLGEDQRRTA